MLLRARVLSAGVPLVMLLPGPLGLYHGPHEVVRLLGGVEPATELLVPTKQARATFPLPVSLFPPISLESSFPVGSLEESGDLVPYKVAEITVNVTVPLQVEVDGSIDAYYSSGELVIVVNCNIK